MTSTGHRETNTWMSENSEDFFFFTPEVFEDWKDLPNFVLGRVGWDSWMAQWAMDNEVDVIDVTKFLHVSHLTGSDGNLAGWGRCGNSRPPPSPPSPPSHTLFRVISRTLVGMLRNPYIYIYIWGGKHPISGLSRSAAR